MTKKLACLRCGVLSLAYYLRVSTKYKVFLCFFASQDWSCNGNAHLDLFHYLLFSYSYYPARFTAWSGLEDALGVFNLHWDGFVWMACIMCHHLMVYAVIFIIVLRRKRRNQQEWHTRLSMQTELINPTETGTVVYTVKDDAVSIPCVFI